MNFGSANINDENLSACTEEIQSRKKDDKLKNCERNTINNNKSADKTVSKRNNKKASKKN